ncbi:hypothetical protein HYS91_05610 [Candidatus Daviesbacteria bacterium]|nr:hypothetical protein [Candidatus Daviesbacteria bacterium]
MDENWSVETYESPSGEKPVDKFVKSLDASTQEKFLRMLDYLAEFGPVDTFDCDQCQD